jgi:hypothetical protein
MLGRLKVFPPRLKVSPSRPLVVALALLASAGLVLESPLFGRDSRENLAAHRDSPGSAVRVPPLADTVVIRSVVRSSLYDAVRSGAARALPYPAHAELTWRLADIFEYRLDMSRDLRPGDEIRVLIERALRPNGSVYRSELLAARLRVSGSAHEAVRARRGVYLDRNGR